jgi:Protein of unknown function (DUF1573)
MRIFTIVLFAALLGGAVGVAVAYVEVRSSGVAAAATEGLSDEPLTKLDGKLPRVKVDNPNYDFGRMERGTEKSHEFVITNVGAAPLTLEIGSTTCKCTLGHVTNKPIAPGESTQVRLEWKALAEQGPFRQSAKIVTNDPIQPEVELTIDGEVVTASYVQPPDLMFDKLAVDETKSAEVYVMAMLQDDLTINSAELTDERTRDKFDVKIEKVARDQLPNPDAKDGARITVTTKPGLPVGHFDQSLTLHTNLEDSPVLHIPVIGRLVGDITVHGTGWIDGQDALMMGSVKSSEGHKSQLNLVVRGENAADVKFDVASVDPEELKVTIGEPKRIKDTLLHVPLIVEVPAGTRPMLRLDTSQGDAGKIILNTTHPTMKEISLRVRFTVER